MIKIVSVGKVKSNHLKALIEDYVEKVSHYSKIEVIECKDEDLSKTLPEKVKEIEGERILKQIKNDDFVILLDLRGKHLDTMAFKDKIQSLIDSSKNIDFVIGGSIGVSDEVKNRANMLLKLSDMTFLHQMTRLIILEQIYRAFKIMNNETYHK